jgi:hypothetical protein
VGSRQMERVLTAAREAGAKVVLVGDPEQLQAIEAGAAFRALAERFGAAEIGAVRRQREDWQREATRELATARTGTALGRYERAGMVQGHGTREEARAALVDGWAAERAAAPERSQVILAYTRADVAELNGLARDRLRQAGELGPDQVVQTERGARAMASGDRLMFLRNERALGAGPGGRGGVAVKNGSLGTVLAVDSKGERLTVRLDGPGGPGGAGGQAGQEGKDTAPVVTFYVQDYGHLDHGYAATVHKAQGVTVDRAHVLASAHMDRHAAYVALTRHRDGVALHYGRDEFADGRQLARTLGRERAKDTSLDYGAGPDRGPARDQVAAFAERRGLDPLRPESEIVVQRLEPEASRPAAKAVRRALGWHEGQRRTRAARPAAGPDRTAEADRAAEAVPAPLLPSHRDAWGRDSQGRGTTPAEITAAATRDARREGAAVPGRAGRVGAAGIPRPGRGMAAAPCVGAGRGRAAGGGAGAAPARRRGGAAGRAAGQGGLVRVGGVEGGAGHGGALRRVGRRRAGAAAGGGGAGRTGLRARRGGAAGAGHGGGARPVPGGVGGGAGGGAGRRRGRAGGQGEARLQPGVGVAHSAAVPRGGGSMGAGGGKQTGSGGGVAGRHGGGGAAAGRGWGARPGAGRQGRPGRAGGAGGPGRDWAGAGRVGRGAAGARGGAGAGARGRAGAARAAARAWDADVIVPGPVTLFRRAASATLRFIAAMLGQAHVMGV